MLGPQLGINPQPLSRWWPQGAVFAADFVSGRFMREGDRISGSSAYTFSRSSEKQARDVHGRWHAFGAGVPARTSLGLSLEPTGNNTIADNVFSSVAPGIIASVSDLPTGWQRVPVTGVTQEIVAVGSDDGFGLPYIDVRQYGTNTSGGTGYLQLQFWSDRVTGLGSNGETVSIQCHAQRLDASAPPASAHTLAMEFVKSGGGYTYRSVPFPTDGTRARVTKSYLIGSGNADETLCSYATYLLAVAAGETIDITRRLSGMQIEVGDTPSSVLLTSGSPVARAPDSLTLHVPAGTHDLLLTFSDDTTQTLSGVSGDVSVPVAPERYLRSASA